jgi:hypothetical protein
MQSILFIEGQFSRVLFSLFYFWVWYGWENVQTPSTNNVWVHILNSRKKIYWYAAVVIKGKQRRLQSWSLLRSRKVSWNPMRSHGFSGSLMKSYEFSWSLWSLVKSFKFPEILWRPLKSLEVSGSLIKSYEVIRSHKKSWSSSFPLGRDDF